MDRARVPKFGTWEKEDKVPYTAYFDQARKGRGGGKMINPNDPGENPELFPDTNGRVIGRKVSLDEPSTPSDHHQRHDSSSVRPSRTSASSEYSMDRSPLHPHYQAKAKVAGGYAASPARDVKAGNDSSHGSHTPGRSRMKQSNRGDSIGTPDRSGAAVPRFGEWDDNDAESAENYTHIFNEVRKERQSASKPSDIQFEPSYYQSPRQRADHRPKGCCFPWLRKFKT